jgi:lysophospholipase L1-like esterase
MKKTILIITAVLMLSFQTAKPLKVIFFGDSITQAATSPQGFITLLNETVKTNKQTDQYELLGKGIGGNKIYDLFFRFEGDVLNNNPDVVVIWVGVNDVWHKRSFQTGTDPDKFVLFYGAMIKKLQERNIKVVLCTPASIGEKTDYTNDMDGDLNKYSQLIRDLATKYNCGMLDFRKVFHAYNLEHNTSNLEKGILTTDGVHLNAAGNKLVADEMSKVIFTK